MGTDIHMRVQVRDKGGHPGGWRDVAGGPDYSSIGHPKPEGIIIYSGRNYELFAMLADVRNRFGIDPIAQPRGLPEGVDDDDTEGGWLGDHSFSWLLLSEWDAYDLGATFKQSAFVGKDKAEMVRRWTSAYKDFPAQGYPTCQGTSDESRWEWMEWEQTKIGVVGLDWWAFVHRLRKLGAPDDVRLVFGFDS